MKKQHKQLHQRQIIYPFLLVIGFCLLVGGGYVYFITRTLDRQELEETTHFAESALTAQLEELGNWTRDYGFWDTALANLIDHLDRTWANDNIGQYLYDSYGINQSYAIDTDDRTLIAYRDGEELADADLLASFPSELKKLLANTRATSPNNPQAACGILRNDEQILLVATAVITPENPDPEIRTKQPRPVLVLVRTLTDEMLSTWGERYQLRELHLSQTAESRFGQLPLRNPAGKIVTQLAWTLSTPGSVLLQELFPLYAAVLLIIAGLTLILLMRIGHFSAEKRKTEESLRESEERLSTTLETTNIGLWDWDIATGACYFNPTYYTMAGYVANEFPATSENFQQRIHPDDLSQVERALKDHFSRAADAYEVEFRFQRKDKKWMWLKAQGKIIQFDTSDNPLRMIGILADITAQKRAEKAKITLETRLHQKNKMEAIGNMAGGIAHDFNNILAIIISNTHLALNKSDKESSMLKYLQRIQEATNRAKELVNQILSFSRQDQPNLRPTNLVAVAHETLKMIQATIPSSVILENRIDRNRDAIIVNGDPTQLQQVLLNLCSNAVHAMNEKGLLEIGLDVVDLNTSEILADNVQDNERFAVLSVRDTGAGMDKDTLERIYDPFFTTKTIGQGTGMGLSVVHGIVKNHHGFISVDSAQHRGTTFKVYFPVDIGEVLEQSKIQQPLIGGSEKILLVDDEQVLANAIAEALDLLGYQVTVTGSSKEALKIFKAAPERFDLVITDQTMPDLSGVELAVKLLETNADLPIVLCSGYSAKVSPAEAKIIGIREFCSKPLEMQQLTTIIRKVLDEDRKSVN